jgi:hypothetical protein
MSVKTLVEVATVLPVEVSVLLRGPHGIGKSQVVRQIARMIAAKEGIDNFELIDRRLSQMSEGDMIGLPSTDGEVTRFNPPEFVKRACQKPVCLFLDELNRATPEVMQAAFQLVLDRELNGWKLHPQTRVFSAVNDSSKYTVNEMDPALLDRFWCVDLEPTLEDWSLWARNDGDISDVVVDFCTQNPKMLDTPHDAAPGEITQSRRTWERLDHSLKAAGIIDDPNHPLFYPICLGFLGATTTIAFVAFAKTVDFQVSAKDILDNYPKVKAKIAKLGQEKVNACNEKLVDYTTRTLKSLTDKQGANLKAYMKDISGELRVALWSKLTQGSGAANLELAKAVHDHCVDLILEVFGENQEAVAAALAAANGANVKPTEKKSKK